MLRAFLTTLRSLWVSRESQVWSAPFPWGPSLLGNAAIHGIQIKGWDFF
jgi:hypothetical protein